MAPVTLTASEELHANLVAADYFTSGNRSTNVCFSGRMEALKKQHQGATPSAEKRNANMHTTAAYKDA